MGTETQAEDAGRVGRVMLVHVSTTPPFDNQPALRGNCQERERHPHKLQVIRQFHRADWCLSEHGPGLPTGYAIS